MRIAARYGDRNVRVFGSVARGDADEASDIDSLVEMDPARSLFDLGGLQLELEALLGWRVDVVSERGLKARVRGRVFSALPRSTPSRRSGLPLAGFRSVAGFALQRQARPGINSSWIGLIAGGDDAQTTYTAVAAHRFASPSCRHLKALSSRFSVAGCPATEGIRLSGERVISPVDSFQSASSFCPLGRTSAPAGPSEDWRFTGWYRSLCARLRLGLLGRAGAAGDGEHREDCLHQLSPH